MVDQRQEVGRRQDLDRPRPGRLRSLRGRADQPAVLGARMQCGEQHPGRRRDPRVEPQLADHDIFGERLDIDHSHRTEQRERDRQVEMRSLLGQVGRGQVHRDPLGRQREPHRGDRAAHPLAALPHRLVGEPDHVECGQPRDQLHLNLDPARLQPQIRHGLHDRRHRHPPAPAQRLPAVTIAAKPPSRRGMDRQRTFRAAVLHI